MSDTPRTDLNHLTVETLRTMKGTGTKIVLASVARQLERELNASNQRIKRLEETLRRIANTDYRGNRSTESQIAFEALNEAKP